MVRDGGGEEEEREIDVVVFSLVPILFYLIVEYISTAGGKEEYAVCTMAYNEKTTVLATRDIYERKQTLTPRPVPLSMVPSPTGILRTDNNKFHSPFCCG